MIDFSVYFQSFLEDRLNDIIDDLKEKKSEYAACRKYLKDNCDKVKKILEKLPEADKKFILKYESEYFNRVASEQEEFYYCGYRDCIKILKHLNII